MRCGRFRQNLFQPFVAAVLIFSLGAQQQALAQPRSTFPMPYVVGLTVTEAMWKGTPVIGGNVGGIRFQIKDEDNGFLVNSSEEAAERIIQIIQDTSLQEKMGIKAKESVTKQFLMTRLLEQYLDLFNSFEVSFNLKDKSMNW